METHEKVMVLLAVIFGIIAVVASWNACSTDMAKWTAITLYFVLLGIFAIIVIVSFAVMGAIWKAIP